MTVAMTRSERERELVATIASRLIVTWDLAKTDMEDVRRAVTVARWIVAEVDNQQDGGNQ